MPSAINSPPAQTVTRPSAAEVPDLSQKLPPLLPRRGPKRQPPRKESPQSTPAPETPPLPPPPPAQELQFLQPTRRILSPHDHELFLASPTYTLIVSFVFTLSDSVRNTPISAISKEPRHPTVNAVLEILDEIENTVAECPPDDNGGSRFGNPAFRTFFDSVSRKLPSLHDRLLPLPSPSQPTSSTSPTPAPATANTELTTYLLSSLGSPVRIDYGSGHELHFLIYLLSLYQLSLLPRSSFPQVPLILLPRYLRLLRLLQSTYYLEPAGSHGVWGLDDYHFLPFLFGASQLAGHAYLRPKSIHSELVLQDESGEWLYLDMVRHVNATKTVQGLRWHSPMLDDISGVKEGWVKVEGGMRKMFLGEVVGKLVVMQHFLFGGLVRAAEGMSVEEEEEVEVQAGHGEGGHEGHSHDGKGWGDCCGIAVPSNAGAVGEMRKRMGGEGLRRLPFD